MCDRKRPRDVAIAFGIHTTRVARLEPRELRLSGSWPSDLIRVSFARRTKGAAGLDCYSCGGSPDIPRAFSGKCSLSGLNFIIPS
ncbi:hypothetical protein NL676_030882 [Syzygium grande]|nr:hypothetical protein NL676_030882 [Syzygium grande]